MDIRMLIGQRKVSYPGEYAPELMTAWDEYSLEENWDGWEADKAQQIASWGDELDRAIEIVVEVPDDVIDAAFATPRVSVSARLDAQP